MATQSLLTEEKYVLLLANDIERVFDYLTEETTLLEVVTNFEADSTVGLVIRMFPNDAVQTAQEAREEGWKVGIYADFVTAQEYLFRGLAVA